MSGAASDGKRSPFGIALAPSFDPSVVSLTPSRVLNIFGERKDQRFFNFILFALSAASGVCLRTLISVNISESSSFWYTVAPTLAANLVGSFLLGALLVFQATGKSRYDFALQTGFCGSLTTYGGYMNDSLRMFIIPSGNVFADSFFNGVFSLVACILFCLTVGFRFGRSAAKVFVKWETRTGQKSFRISVLYPSIIFGPIAAGIIVLLVSASSSDWVLPSSEISYVYACLLGIPGAYLRAILSVLLNNASDPYIRTPFLGTMVANIVGSFITAVCLSAIKYRFNGDSAILSALDAGFAGALSTMSTYIKEIDLLIEKKRNKGSTKFSIKVESAPQGDAEQRWAMERSPTFYILATTLISAGIAMIGWVVGGWTVV